MDSKEGRMDSKEGRMDSKKGRSKKQMDAGATSKDGTAAGKGKKRQEPSARKKKLVPVKGKKAEKPIVRKKATMVREPRRPPSQYELTMPVYGNRDVFNTWWMRTWGDLIGSMAEKTAIPSAQFTDSFRSTLSPTSTLQIFEAKISSKVWPLHVYGYIAARDLVDYKRNIIFERQKDNCQEIDEMFPYLLLTGPARSVVLIDPVYFEADLKVKGTGQSEDQDLIYIAESFVDSTPSVSEVYKCAYTNKISTLELTFGHIIWSVEAAISMKVIHGSWPEGFRASFTAKTASINDMTIWLLQNFSELALNDDGTIKLERHVVSAELKDGEYLEVSVNAYCIDGPHVEDGLHFTPQDRGRVKGTLKVDSCEIEVTVAWSLIQRL